MDFRSFTAPSIFTAKVQAICGPYRFRWFAAGFYGLFRDLIYLLIGGFFILLSTEISAQQVSLTLAEVAYQTADKAMNNAYRNAQASMPQVEFLELQNGQKGWISQRNQRRSILAAARKGAGEDRHTLTAEYWRDETERTKTRTKIIFGLAHSEKISKKTWEGEWQDGEGGLLEIKENKNGSISFLLTCVRGPEKHSGRISGNAHTNQLQARFTVALPPEKPFIRNGHLVAPKPKAWLTFVKRGKHLQVFGANVEYYHGVEGYFDGVYIRTAKLRSTSFRKAMGQVKP